MATIPVPRKVGGNFLDGDGNFQLSTDQNIWTQLIARGEPFHKGIDSVAEVRFGVDTKRDFTFGRTGSFALALKEVDSDRSAAQLFRRASEKYDRATVTCCPPRGRCACVYRVT